MSPFKRVLKFAKPYRKYIYLNVIFNLLYSLLSIISVGSFIPILKILFRDKRELVKQINPVEPALTYEYFQYQINSFTINKIDIYGEAYVLAFFCSITIGLFLFRNLFRYLAQYFMISLRSGVSRDIRDAMYNKILALPVSYFSDQKKGDLMSRITSDIGAVRAYILAPIIELIRSPFMLIATLATLFFMNYKLTLVALLILPIMGFVISSISKSLRKDAAIAQNHLGTLMSFVEETLGATKIIKIFNAEKILSKKFHATNTTWRSLTNRVERKYDLSSPISEFLGSVTMIALVYYGGRLIFEGKSSLDGESFLAFIGLFFQLLDPAKSLSKSISDIARGNASAERLFEVLDSDIKVKEKSNAIDIKEFKNKIEFNNVTFEYIKGEPVIQNFNLTIQKGESVALVGKSGSGKTTIAYLLSRFYDVTDGEILIDGMPLRDLKIDSYRSLMGMVTQDSVLFNDSIYNNILMGRENATQTEIESAAATSNALEFIKKLPKGFQTNIGEGGSKLSGGQKQRLAIARAVVKNAPIMILDEATSALDTHSERLVQDALNKMMASSTSVIIAHRLSTIQSVDKIVVMSDGKIKEQGNHEELIALNGTYAKLIRMQNFD